MKTGIGVVKGNTYLENGRFAVWDCYSDKNSHYNNKLHFHEFYELTLVYEGQTVFGINGSDFNMERGCIQLSRPSDYHVEKQTSDSGYIKYFNIIFIEDVISESVANRLYHINQPLYLRLDEENFQKLLTEIRELYNEYEVQNEKKSEAPFGGEKLIANQIENLCIKFIRLIKESSGGEVGANDDKIINKALLYIRQNYRNNITLEDVAKEVNLSTGYFCSYFRNIMKVNFSKYLLDYRLNITAGYIALTDIPLKEIAVMNGFQTFSYFSAAFKKRYGCSPIKYRKTASK